MGRLYREPTDYQAVDFAFDQVDEMARLLHSTGHRDVAALLDCMADLRELSRRRADKGEGASLIGSSSETLDYVMAQMAELAEIMARNGADDAAMLFRVPGQLRAASEARQYGVLAALRQGEQSAARATQDDTAPLPVLSVVRGRARAASGRHGPQRGWA